MKTYFEELYPRLLDQIADLNRQLGAKICDQHPYLRVTTSNAILLGCPVCRAQNAEEALTKHKAFDQAAQKVIGKAISASEITPYTAGWNDACRFIYHETAHARQEYLFGKTQ